MNRAKILIVDDDPVICELMVECLPPKKYDITTVYNGVEGLRICAEKDIDLVILDLNMPRMDGYLFMERLRARHEEDRVKRKMPKIFILSAVDVKDDLGLTSNLGAEEFMSKPFEPSKFNAVVKRLMEA